MRELDLKTLRLFVAVCDHRNIARAAKEAHIEPSAISKRIAQLEADLGVPILARSRRGVEPTQAGMALLEHARSVLFTMDRIASDIASFGEGLKGRVSVCASASAIAEKLLDDIAAFMREPTNKNIMVDIEERLSQDLIRQLREGAASIGVCWDNVDLQGLEHRAYRQDRLALAVPLGHPLAELPTVAFHQTLGYDHVGLPPATAVQKMLQLAAAQAGRTISFRVIVSSFDAAFRVVAAGLGISVVPVEVSTAYGPQLGVRIIPLTDVWAQRRFIVCFKSFEMLQPAAQRMVEHLTGRANGDKAAE
ncbi:LysR family transcriptional regulator [Burkholderia territorii]|uniref:LysR family transcriptional regulator n=1 Tax=Burkholderia cepacia complex TaxID=87882 RepID=UPI00075A5799|nr:MULTISPECIES: LysR family transcriptional regulator [Burkholderia cepacia complex]AOI66375.1 LysR family transcriptional regulator [Burkholderia territorii]KUY89231.1 LysR family transcriptional regulator [Burkholderia territorii]KUZ14721.1 LysR family transcriptional regulator [Burkholderia territorii]